MDPRNVWLYPFTRVIGWEFANDMTTITRLDG